MKKFGLDIKSKDKKEIKKLSVFNESSSDDDDDDNDDDQVHIPTLSFSSSFKKQDTSKLEKAIEEDPTIYEYDSLHEQISTAKAKVQVTDNKTNSKLSKLFLESAQKKNMRYQVVQAKKARKENEIDKTEVFVSNSYKKEQEKLLALDKADQEQAKREEILAMARGRGATAIYRYMLNEKLASPTKQTPATRSDPSADETEPPTPDTTNPEDPVKPAVKEQSPEEDEIVKSAIKAKLIREKASLLMQKPDTKQIASKFAKKNDEITTEEAKNRYLSRKQAVKRSIVEDDSD